MPTDQQTSNRNTTALIEGLNEGQSVAVAFDGGHALVLAGAGCGKTKTIIARCERLINAGVPGHQICVLTFTRKSADEIVARVESKLGSRAKDIHASTFHGLCMWLIRRYPAAFGCEGTTVIDRDDALDLFKAFRGRTGKKEAGALPSAASLADIYSFARNTRSTLTKAIENHDEAALIHKAQISAICVAYEERKRARRYLDYDDILDIVATRLADGEQVRAAIASRFKHVLVDEFQDTNPLQWHLLNPFVQYATLFCVGDDAQSIYGFRGADFKNVASFTTRVPGSTILKLEQNYRSTQEILDVSNWLLGQSPVPYNKNLRAVRGSGITPSLREFANDWQEAGWIASDLESRRKEGAEWKEFMVLTRSAFSARTLEACLAEKNIPYKFIGGTKLFQTAHVKDLVSCLRIVSNPEDEIAWSRFLRLWPSVGEVTANKIIDKALGKGSLAESLACIADSGSVTARPREALAEVSELMRDAADAVRCAVKHLGPVLEQIYQNDWDRRKRDITLIEKLAAKHESVGSFIEAYMLDPVTSSIVQTDALDNVVTVITVHSAKGAESKVCYVLNVSPGAYPSSKALASEDETEEERRVLYVALTRAKDELIITRRAFSTYGYLAGDANGDSADAYFFNDLPSDLVDSQVAPYVRSSPSLPAVPGNSLPRPKVGINLG